jgi:colicin import membrane protein
MQISDSVVQRLKDELAAPGSSQQKEEQPPPPEPPKAENPPQPPPSQPPPAPEAAAQQKPPVIQYVERESSMTSLRVRAEKERELAEAEAYWRRRFVKQEQEV